MQTLTSQPYQPPFILTSRQLFKWGKTASRYHTPPNWIQPGEEGTNNKIAKVANGQNKNNLYSEKESGRSFNLFAENQFLSILWLSHCFCQFHRPLREEGAGVGVGGGAGNYCNRPWSLTPLLLSACQSASGKNKPRSVTPISTRALTRCAVTPLPGSDAGISQLASGGGALP